MPDAERVSRSAITRWFSPKAKRGSSREGLNAISSQKENAPERKAPGRKLYRGSSFLGRDPEHDRDHYRATFDRRAVRSLRTHPEDFS